MKRKILFVCKANVTRSKIAEAVFSQKMRKYGLENSVEVKSRGMVAVDSYVPDRVQNMLRAKGYDEISRQNSHPRAIQRADWIESDIVFTMSDQMGSDMLRWYKNHPHLQRVLDSKIRNLPKYGLEGAGSDTKEIFDPESRLVTPDDIHSRSSPLTKNVAATVLLLFPNVFGDSLVYYGSAKTYIPSREGGSYSSDKDRLYQRAFDEIENSVDGAISRMNKEGYFS